ncbi:MAG TPA: hypothetical protein PKK43_09055, partial [Spirochaetota bacterium]|nr:hypothetical protein [Spirochaetota bacterium]
MRLKILITGAAVLTTIVMSLGLSLAGSGHVRILNNGDPQTVITTMEGRRIFIDVADPYSVNELPGK